MDKGGPTVGEKFMDADEFFNIYDESTRNQRLREYIDGRIDFKIEEYFRALFAAKEKAAEAGRRCLICGAPFERHGKGAAKYCPEHQNTSTRVTAGIAAWTFLVDRYYPLAEKIMALAKAEGRWPD